ncbi:hypothetical protein L195_g050186 [Trifolium pratense]|uniref:Uncharacterized protein n=1 Tax=Trifolium pratense TaxID=57577 RepID=A0A2K3JSK3_TRIPR|nr:hypothetical protein L195_g050186 [Trifolium pratense]
MLKFGFALQSYHKSTRDILLFEIASAIGTPLALDDATMKVNPPQQKITTKPAINGDNCVKINGTQQSLSQHLEGFIEQLGRR